MADRSVAERAAAGPRPQRPPRPVYGDPSIWGEALPRLAEDAVLTHTPDIRVFLLPYTDNTIKYASAWKRDVRKIHSDIFPVRYNETFFTDLEKWNFRTVVGVDFAEELERPTVVGVATGRQGLRRYLRWWQSILPGSVVKSNTAWIMTLAVQRPYRRTAIASEILSTLVAALQCGSVALHCTDTNTSALRLYRRHGFKTIEHIPRHYHFNSQWHDALLLRKDVVSEPRSQSGWWSVFGSSSNSDADGDSGTPDVC